MFFYSRILHHQCKGKGKKNKCYNEELKFKHVITVVCNPCIWVFLCVVFPFF